MSKLKLNAIEDDKPVRLTIDLPATVHRDLVVYAEAIGQGAGKAAIEPAKLVPPTPPTSRAATPSACSW